MEAERRLAMAKRDRPRATPKRTKRRQDESEEEDEDEAAEDSDEMEVSWDLVCHLWCGCSPTCTEV